MKKLVIDVEAGTEEYEDLTAEEKAQAKKDRANAEAIALEQSEAEADHAARLATIQEKLGLTDDEFATLRSSLST
jgi:hypothetical protein